MSRSLERESLEAHLAATQRLLDSTPKFDVLGAHALNARKQAIENKLRALAEPSGLAEVVVFFDGDPVVGSHAIDVGFAAKALSQYHDLILKQVAFNQQGNLAQRGPVPGRSGAHINIVGFAPGSFGFLLQEEDLNGPPFLSSALAEAVSTVSDTLSHMLGTLDQYILSIANLDHRIFGAAKSFIKTIDDANAVFRLAENDRDFRFSRHQISQGADRVKSTEIEQEEVEVVGALIGVTPIERHFEFRDRAGSVFSGKFGPLISQDFLERIENNVAFIGTEFAATFQQRVTRGPGARTKTDFTLMNLPPA